MPLVESLPVGRDTAQWQVWGTVARVVVTDPGAIGEAQRLVGRPAATTWRTASVGAHSCVEANALSTAALVRGPATPPWLREIGAPARLVDADGVVTTFGAWPAGPGRPAR
jgi:hypothetical protein